MAMVIGATLQRSHGSECLQHPTSLACFVKEESRPMKVLLTGALGNVGEYTLQSLLDEGHDVVTFELLTPAAQRRAAKFSDRVQIIWGNITDPSSLRDALDGVEAVIHLAGMVPPNVDKNVTVSTKVNVGRHKTPHRTDGGFHNGEAVGLCLLSRRFW